MRLLENSLMFGFWCVQDWGGGLKLLELKAWDLNKKAELYYLWNLESDAATKTLLERAGQSNLKGAVYPKLPKAKVTSSLCESR